MGCIQHYAAVCSTAATHGTESVAQQPVRDTVAVRPVITSSIKAILGRRYQCSSCMLHWIAIVVLAQTTGDERFASCGWIMMTVTGSTTRMNCMPSERADCVNVASSK